MIGINSRCLCAALALVACAARPAHAQEKPAGYPKKPIRIVVGIAPAGGLDLMTRLGARKLIERFGQAVIVDNRPGGGTVIAMDIVLQAPADGYTLLAASDTLMLNGVLRRAKYDVRKAFVPIVQLTRQPYVLIVTPSLPVKSLKELIAYAKSKPGALNLHNSYAYFAPDGTPRGIIRAINSAVSEGMAAPDTVKALTADGSEIMARDSPGEFKARFDREYAELENLIKSVKIKIA